MMLKWSTNKQWQLENNNNADSSFGRSLALSVPRHKNQKYIIDGEKNGYYQNEYEIVTEIFFACVIKQRLCVLCSMRYMLLALHEFVSMFVYLINTHTYTRIYRAFVV